MRVLVTGGCGFIGSHIADMLAAQGNEVAVVDNLCTGNIGNLNPEAKFFKIDITSKELRDVFEAVKPEVVYHEAAQIDIQKSIKDTVFDTTVNIVGTVNLLECCRDYGVKKIIYASSAAVYGNPQYLGVDEDHPVNPISFYGISKHTPEHYIKTFSDLYGLRYTILRYANVYGVRQDPKGEGGVVSIFLDRLLKGQASVIFGDGEQTRDFIYVKDIAAANLAALDNGDGEIVNVSTNLPVTVNELYRQMRSILDSSLEADYGPERKGDILHSYLNNEKACSLLDWKPRYSLEQGLRETVEYYKEKLSR